MQVLPPPEQADEVMNAVELLINSGNNSLYNLLANSNYQTAGARVLSISSILNVPTEMVNIFFWSHKVCNETIVIIDVSHLFINNWYYNLFTDLLFYKYILYIYMCVCVCII